MHLISSIWLRQHGRPCIGSQKQLRPCTGLCGRCGCIFFAKLKRQDEKKTRWLNNTLTKFAFWAFPSSSVIKMLNARPDHAVDCKMNPWQSWSHCTKTCSGAGAVLMVVSWNPGNPNMSDSMRIPNERSLGNCLQVFQGTFLAEPQTKSICSTRCLKWWDMWKGWVFAERGMNSWTPQAIHQWKYRSIGELLELRRRTAIPKSSNRSVSELSVLSVCVYCIFVGSVQQKRNQRRNV